MSTRSKSRSVNKKDSSSSKNKFVTRKIKVNTPYLAEGVITKKYLNLEYLKEQDAKREKEQINQRKSRDDYQPHFIRPEKSPYELALSQSPKRKNKYEKVKSKYLVDPIMSATSSKSMLSSSSYVYDVGLGNNSPIIVRIMKRRVWWRSYQESFRPPCFFWRMYLKEFKFDILAPNQKDIYTLNRLERHGQIGSKDNLYRNLWFHCQKSQQDINQIVPLTFSFRIGEKEFEEDLQEFAHFFKSIEENVELDAVKRLDSSSNSNACF
jgi:hypothetical protein